MRVRHLGAAILAALVAQTTIAWLVGGARVNIDLPLVAVVLAAVAGGPMTGFLSGAVTGCAQDWLSGGIVGVSGLSKSLVGLVAGAFTFHVLAAGIVFKGLMIAVATVVHIWAFVGIYGLMPQAGPSAAWDVVLTQALANTAIGVAAAAIVQYGPRPSGAGLFERSRLRRIG